jgi:hypothetical protein
VGLKVAMGAVVVVTEESDMKENHGG